MTFAVASAIVTAVVGIITLVLGTAADATGRQRLAVATVGAAGVLLVVVVIRFIALG